MQEMDLLSKKIKMYEEFVKAESSIIRLIVNG